jgi:hypothetical protein
VTALPDTVHAPSDVRAKAPPRFSARAWQTILAASFFPLWAGFALLPDIHFGVRAPAVAMLMVLAGVGAEMAASPSSGGKRKTGAGTLWIVPAGAVLALMWWLATTTERPAAATPLAAAAVILSMALQRIECAGPELLRGAAHALNIGAVFALAFGAYILSAAWGGVMGTSVVAATTAPATMVVLRGVDAPPKQLIALTGVSVILVGELAAVLLGGTHSPLAASGALLLGLYLVSAVCHALLERAPLRAYVEVIVVALIATAFVATAIAR